MSALSVLSDDDVAVFVACILNFNPENLSVTTTNNDSIKTAAYKSKSLS